jgi:hypothetical protein
VEDHPTEVGAKAPAAFSGMGLLTIVLPFVATIASLLFGILIGGVAGWVVKPTQQPIEYLETASLAELQLVCEPVVEEQKTQLAKVKDQIGVLEATVIDRERRITELEGLAAKQGSRKAVGGRDYSAEVVAAREQLAEAKLRIELLEQVKSQLIEQLTAAQQRLSVVQAELTQQVAITDVLRDENGRLEDEVIVQQWFRFVTESQLEVCERGGRKKTDDCRGSVVNEIAQVKREFVHCVRSGQAAPAAALLAKGQAMPHFARMMNQDDKHLSGWYLQMCDPTLPEQDLATAAAPTPAPLPPLEDLDAPDPELPN